MHGSFGRAEARPSSVYTCSFASWRVTLRRGRYAWIIRTCGSPSLQRIYVFICVLEGNASSWPLCMDYSDVRKPVPPAYIRVHLRPGGPRFVVAVMHGLFGRAEARPSSVYTCSFASWRAMLRRGRMLERREPRHDGVLHSCGRQCDFQAPPWFRHLHGKPEGLGMVGSTVDLDSILHR